MRKLIQGVVMGAALALGATGCSVMDGQQSAGAYASDSSITAKVKAKFVEDPVVSAMRLNVDTMNGVVQVSGFAKSAEEERRALQLARSVEGVKSVRDSIEVRPAAQ
jgi:osmotically-inducible protein OsmY